MNQTTLTNAANTAAEKSKNILVTQVDRQAHALGSTVTQTARDLEQIGDQLRQSGTIASAAQLADWAAKYVATAGTYLENGSVDRFIADLEAFSRDRPWAVAASTAVVGFVASRIVKSSSAKRLNTSGYGEYGYTGNSAASTSLDRSN